jgi:small-conductance mechanosensitive channel
VLRRVALIQGLYYLATGVWPLLHMSTFLLVTGPKTDLWLVNTVGVLVAVVGVVLISAAWRVNITGDIALLAVGSALGLAAIDLVYALSDRISDVYLLDAAAEIGLAVLWGVGLRRR